MAICELPQPELLHGDRALAQGLAGHRVQKGRLLRAVLDGDFRQRAAHLQGHGFAMRHTTLDHGDEGRGGHSQSRGPTC